MQCTFQVCPRMQLATKVAASPSATQRVQPVASTGITNTALHCKQAPSSNKSDVRSLINQVLDTIQLCNVQTEPASATLIFAQLILFHKHEDENGTVSPIRLVSTCRCLFKLAQSLATTSMSCLPLTDRKGCQNVISSV